MEAITIHNFILHWEVTNINSQMLEPIMWMFWNWSQEKSDILFKQIMWLCVTTCLNPLKASEEHLRNYYSSNLKLKVIILMIKY